MKKSGTTFSKFIGPLVRGKTHSPNANQSLASIYNLNIDNFLMILSSEALYMKRAP